MITVIDTIRERVSAVDYTLMDRPFEANEVKVAVFDMHPTKSQGSYGFNARFFQRFWPVIGDHVTAEALAILNEEVPIKDLNDTLICLITKFNKPTVVSEFRPISMCGTSYKIVAKVIANRIRQVMGRVIDQVQSAWEIDY